MNPNLIGTAVGAALAGWLLYRRVRRNFGRQPLSEWRLYVRTALLALIGMLLLRGTAANPAVLAALLGGLAAGATLGYFALRHTTFEATAEGRFYTPHSYFGLAVTSLLVGRLAYRFLQLYQSAEAAAPEPNPLAGFQRSPLTTALFGLLIGYYLLLNAGILRRARTLAAGPAEPGPP
ncbi:MAG: DUF1453 domain-containing protein [Proteobacteria bacterium]|nr:DUF1453 domain-containing protein [Pseudomonadota bacterium]